MTLLRLLPILSCLALAGACEPPPDDPPAGGGGGDTGGESGPGDGGETDGAGGGGDAGDGGSGGGGAETGGGGDAGDGGGGGAGAASLTVSFAPGEAPAGASAIVLDVAGVALFSGKPRWRDADSPCHAGEPGALVPVAASVTVPFGGDRVPFLTVEVAAGSSIEEVWVAIRHGALSTPERTHEVHAGRLCTMPDGLQYVLVRGRPGAVTIDRPREVALELGREQLPAGQVSCRTSPSVEECATSDDGSDGDPDTRLRWEFAHELPARTVE